MNVRVQRDAVTETDRAAMAALFADVPALIACIPGAAVTGTRADGAYDAEIGASYGDMGAMFRGTLRVERTADGTFVGRLAGHDELTGTGAIGSVTIALADAPGGSALRTTVDLDLSGVMGPLAAAAARYTIPLLLDAFAANAAREARARSVRISY